jgi:site-specific DNA-methyltransferase (adenine-specific)
MLTPYFQDDTTTLYCADNREVLPTLEDKSVDHVFADPPYSEETHKGARTDIRTKLIDFDHISLSELRATFNQFGRVSRRWVVSFMDWRHIYHIEKEPPEGLRFVRFGMWRKPNGAPQFTGDRPATGWEGVAVLHALGGRMVWNGGGKHGVWECPKVHGLHHTQKPLNLLRTLIRDFTDSGETILDPFMGSGTTGAACALEGRRFIGMELREEDCERAKSRILRAKGIPYDAPRSIRRQIETPLFPQSVSA